MIKLDFDKLKEIIKNSSLSLSEQENFLDLFSKAGLKDLSAAVEVFNEKPEWIKKMYDNYKAKKRAIGERNINFWEEILKKEEEDLTNL